MLFVFYTALLTGTSSRRITAWGRLKTSLGKGRAFIRYCLVHQRLADTLQQCLMNQKVTCDWYYARSPFLKSHLNADIINHLYELNEIQFDVASRGYDLDSEWPTFARRTLGSAVSSVHGWRPPSRCSSVNSLVSSYSQQAQDFLPGPDFGTSLLGDLGELGELSCSAADDLRIELDQSELRQQQLLEQVRLLTDQSAELRQEVSDLQEKLFAAESASQTPYKKSDQAERANGQCPEDLEVPQPQETSRKLEERLSIAENKNMELLAKLDGALNEKGQQVANYCDSAWKIQELLSRLKEVEVERLEAKRESEDRGRKAERLAQELKAREEKLKETEEKLAQLAKLRASTEEDKITAVQQTDELRASVNRLQGALSLKEREAGNLHTQLQDLQSSLEARDQQMEVLKKEHEDLQQKGTGLKESMDGQIVSLQEQLKLKEAELTASTQKVLQLENQSRKLSGLSQKLESQSKKLDEYKTQCTNLMEINAKLLQTVKRTEESSRELSQSRAAMENEFATLKASEKQLKTRLDLSGLSVEEREKNLLEENQRLEESIQNTRIKSSAKEVEMRRLENEVKELRAAVIEKPEGFDTRSSSREPATGSDPHLSNAKAEEETMVKKSEQSQDLYLTQTFETGQAASRLALAEAQLDLNMKEVSRLQEEVVELRAQVQVTADEKMKLQALQEVTESSREDLRAQAEQLKAQVEELNRRHIEELLRCREREEALAKERDTEAQTRAELQAQVASIREDLRMLKRQNSTLALENGDAREALHRANTETAELGVHVCMLTGQNEEAQLRWDELSTRLQELEEETQKEAHTLSLSVETLSKDNARLLEELKGKEELTKAMQELQARLEEVQEEARNLQEGGQKEMDALRLQLSEETIQHQDQIKVLNEELQAAKAQMDADQAKVSTLGTKLAELEVINCSYSQLIEEKTTYIANYDSLLLQKEEQINQIKEDLSKAQEEFALAQKACQDLSENLRRIVTEKQTCDLKTSAEIDDLYRTKRNLEERLIELIRDKDALWQKSDALEFEQKLRAEEQTDRDLTYCLSCHTQFSWWLRRHNCKLCGRPFCYYCCSNTVSTQQGGSRERCCKDCYMQHSAVVERHPHEELGSPGHPPYSPLASTPTRTGMPSVTVALQFPRPDDAVFDIITDEEVNCIYDGDSLPYTTALTPGSGQQGQDELSSGSASGGDLAAEESPEELLTSVQDAEICLLKSGEITLCETFTVMEIAEFGEDFRELFIKSSCYSLIPVTVDRAGPTISWVFSSSPKSISFSVVYRESTDAPLEQAKVLIPLTRCNSHKESMQGQVKARKPGEYSLIFDNSFSRFISKKVLYRLSVDQPVVYDGSDCP